MSFRYDGFRCALFLLCALCFGGTALGVALWSGGGVLPFYLVGLTGTLTAATGAAALAGPEPRRYPKLDLFICLALFAAAAALRFRHLGSVALWSDEDLQNWFVLRRVNIVYMAAYGQQPPLHHFLALTMMKLFGVSLFNLRFFTALFGSLAVPLFYCLLLRFGVHRLLALCGGALFLTNGWLVSYSQEAKPYMLAVFLAVVWLRAAGDCLLLPARWPSLVALGASGTLLLYSVGVQPMLFLFLLSGLGAGYLAWRRERGRLLGWGAATAASFLAFVPDLYAIRLLSAEKGYIRPFPGLRAYLGDLWLGFPGYLGELRLLLEGNWVIYVPAVVGGALAFRQLRRQPAPPQVGTLFALAGCALFPVAIYAFFRLFVTLQLMYYYLILLWPLLFFAAAAALECGRRACGRAGAGVLALAAAGTALVAAAEARKPSVKTAEQNIPGVYRYWRERAEERSLAFYFTVNESPPDPAISPEIGFIGSDYYYTPDVARKVALSSAWDRQLLYGMQMDAIYDEIENPTEPRRFYFYAFNRENEFNFAAGKFSPELRARGEQFPDPGYGDWAAASLLQIENPFGSRATLTRFFSELAAQVPRDSLNLKAYTALAALAIQAGRCREAERYFAKIQPLCSVRSGDCYAELRIRKNYQRFCPAGVKGSGALW